MGTGLIVSLGESAYLRLRHDIMTGKLMPGAIVSERELAQRYDMSKTPVREAIGQVCREGLVQRLPGRGYRISPITIKEIVDLFEMRIILETASVEKAAARPHSDRCMDMLREKAKITYNLEDEDSHTEFLMANREFHITIAEATGNGRIVQVLQGLFVEMERLFHLGLVIRDSSEEMATEHQALVAACEDGDVQQAKAVMGQQINASKNRILEAIMGGGLGSVQATG